MAAYLISEYLEIQDQSAMAEYRHQVGATIEAYGGRYIARAGKTVPLGRLLSDDGRRSLAAQLRGRVRVAAE